MAGHSQFKNIMHRKGAQDGRKARLFNKIAREITVAAKLGMPDPAANPRLRAAMSKARENDMPRDRIEKAVKAATAAAGGENYDEVRYEGYGPGGTAIIVEALTDNRNRTAADLRTLFSKMGGSLGELNSVAFMFQRCGQIIYPAKIASSDAMLEAAIEAGADDVQSTPEQHEVLCAFEALGAVRDVLEQKLGAAQSARLAFKPLTFATPSLSDATDLLKLLDALDELDDVQDFTTNADLPAELLAQLG